MGEVTHDSPLVAGVLPSEHCSHFEPSVVYLMQLGMVRGTGVQAPLEGYWPEGQVLELAAVHWPWVLGENPALQATHYPAALTKSQLAGFLIHLLLMSWYPEMQAPHWPLVPSLAQKATERAQTPLMRV